MRLRSLSFRGLLRFTGAEPVSIDFDTLGPGLVALVGPNGAGKTTCLEAPLAALYRTFPSRPGWYEHAHGRDAFVEVVFLDGADTIKVRTQIDAERRTTEQYVFVNGASATTGRAKEAEAEIERRFGSLDLLLASVVAAQSRAGNFLLMPKAQRKELFAELLGLSHLEELHEVSKARRATREQDLAAARALHEQAELQAAGFGDANQVVATAQKDADAAAHTLEVAREEEASATSALERARGAADRLASVEATHRTAAQAVRDADAALNDALDLGPRARQEAARRRAAAEKRADEATALVDRANVRYETAGRRIDTRRGELDRTLAERPALVEAERRVKELEGELERLQAAQQTHTANENAIALAHRALEGAEARLQDAEARLKTEQARLADEAQLLDRVPCTSAEKWIPFQGHTYERGELAALAETCPLLGAARTAKERAPRLKVDQAAVDAVRAAAEKHEAAIATLREGAAADPKRIREILVGLPDLRSKAARLPVAAEARKALEALTDEMLQAKSERERDCGEAEAIRVGVKADSEQIESDLVAALAAAQTRETEARARIDAARHAAGEAALTLTRTRDELGALSVPTAEADLTTARQARYGAEQTMRSADRNLAAAIAVRDDLARRQEALPRLRDDVAVAERELGDWRLVEQALGKDGIQALEIDAAGPEVARLANELLEACYGPRFSISFETLRELKSKAGAFAEAFDVLVFDRGGVRPVEALSGGERVVIGEALGLAIGIFSARKSSVRWMTGFRDETAGALDMNNATRYIDMLRKAMKMAGLHQLIFVSHSPEIWERADVRLLVKDGTVRIAGQDHDLIGAAVEANA